MSYDERVDGRGITETRPIEAKAGVIPNADGSAYFKIGNTWAYAAVYGPKNIYPKFLSDPTKGVLRVKYNMMPFSSGGDRVRPGTNRRGKEISMVTEKSLLPVVDLKHFPNSVVDIFIELPQTDAGTRCAGITAAAMALADAGIMMKDMVASVAVGRVDDKVVVDLNYEEEAYENENGVADIPIAMIPSTGEVTLLQMDGHLTKEQLSESLRLAHDSIIEINKIQRKALKDKYEVSKNEE